MVLQFRSEAIKTENPATVQCDAFQIDIFSRQEARQLRLLVAVRVWFKFFSSLEDGRRKTKKLPLNVESPSPPLSKYCLLVPNALLKCGGQPIIQVGLLWILHSIKAGL